MQKTGIWAGFLVVCGSIRFAQGGAQAPAGGGGRGGEVTPDIFWLNIRCDDNYAKN